ncbi:hypothetical protein E2C01_077246 [Portunus trituberculatus]|uniref:Uncharacterized protein n=1 Tax=Portunus trituberculatus TaxID=210409 RepID=A0A5B7IFC5_PORTR|nr:hypothetical protein [Portunus trituberculatus]
MFMGVVPFSAARQSGASCARRQCCRPRGEGREGREGERKSKTGKKMIMQVSVTATAPDGVIRLRRPVEVVVVVVVDGVKLAPSPPLPLPPPPLHSWSGSDE